MTVEQLRKQVAETLAQEGLTALPQAAAIQRALNRAKTDMAARLEALDENKFVAHKDYAVSAGALSITLPDGTVGGEPGFVRLTGLARVASDGAEYEIYVYDRRDISRKVEDVGFYMYPEGDALYWSTPAGAAEAMTIRLYYVGRVPDLSDADTSATYWRMPSEWCDLIGLQAAIDLLPAASLAIAKWRTRRNERLGLLLEAGQRRFSQGPLRVREVRDDIEDT